jgi:hypothetical protein
VLLVVLAFGCKPASPEFPTCDDDGRDITFESVPTWTEDVAPIVQAECLGCHRTGGVAPWAFESYESIAGMADQVSNAVVHRRMPPGSPTSCGECATFANDARLTPAQIATVRAWAEGGAPEGEGEMPANPPPPAGLSRVDQTLVMPEPYTPDASADDDYRCFVVTPELDDVVYLSGFEVRPGQPELVHHVILYGMYTQEHRDLVADLDAADPGVGFSCFGTSGVDDAPMLAAWAPGTPPIEYPEGTGVRLRPGMQLVMQVHYHTEADASPDRSAMDLHLESSVDQEAVILPVYDWELELQPGQSEAATSDRWFDFIGPVGPVQIHAFAPHMHTRGRSMQVEMWEGTNYQCMGDIPAWDFDWQGMWFYEEPIELPGGANVKITCTYDTRGAEDVITWGDGTGDEMCLALFYVTGIPQHILDDQYAQNL